MTKYSDLLFYVFKIWLFTLLAGTFLLFILLIIITNEQAVLYSFALLPDLLVKAFQFSLPAFGSLLIGIFLSWSLPISSTIKKSLYLTISITILFLSLFLKLDLSQLIPYEGISEAGFLLVFVCYSICIIIGVNYFFPDKSPEKLA